jgi:hypothetical protein
MTTSAVVGSTNEHGRPYRRFHAAGSFLCCKRPAIKAQSFVLRSNKLATLFGAEHNMKKILYYVWDMLCSLSYGWAVSRLRRFGILIRLPTALPWANLRARLRRSERRCAGECALQKKRANKNEYGQRCFLWRARGEHCICVSLDCSDCSLF